MLTDEELLKLEELEEKATPDGWVWSECLGEFGTECEGVSVHRGEDEELICDMSDEPESDWRDNAKFIVALRNAAKSLIASARREKEYRAALEKEKLANDLLLGQLKSTRDNLNDAHLRITHLYHGVEKLRDGPGNKMEGWKHTWAHEYASRLLADHSVVIRKALKKGDQ